MNKKKLLKSLEESIDRLTKDKKKYGLLFSGGVDSCLLAILLKRKKVKFTCFFAYVKHKTQAKDLVFAKMAAKELALKLKVITIDNKELQNTLPNIIKTITSSNPIQVGIAIPIYFSCKEARKRKIKVLFSGLGSDELFAGYSRFSIRNHREETKKCLINIQKDNLNRDQAIAKNFDLEINYPYLDKKTITIALQLPTKQLISSNKNKIIIREIAQELGLSKEFAERKKIASQYGSNSDRALEKLAKENKFKTKTDFLATLNKERIGALYSGGKDSNLSLWIIQNQGKDICCLISLIPDNKDSYMFQTPDYYFLKLQAKALSLPLIIKKTKGEKEKELEDLNQAIINAKEKYKLNGIVVGALYSNYQKLRIENICEKLNLKLYAPLWHMKEEEEMKMLLNNNFKFVICKIAGLGLSEKYLGKVFKKNNLKELKELEKKYKINIAGEGGEYETLVLDAPAFKYKIKILECAKEMQNEFTGNLIITKAKIEKKYI